MRAHRWPLSVSIVILIAVALAAVAVVGGGALAPASPNPAGPAWDSFTGLSVYDPAMGYDLWLLAYGSTWTYAHGVWSNITSSAGIPTNMTNNVRMVYDSHDGYVLLYGGLYSYKGLLGSTYDRPLADTWVFETGRWTNLTETVRGAPPPRALGLMAYDSEDNEAVLFGGSRTNLSSTIVGGPPMSETWTYAAGVWTNSTVPAPPSLGGIFGSDPFSWLVDDSADGYLLYYDALAHSPYTPGSITWSFRGGVWTNRTASFGAAPEFYSFGGLAYDSTSRTVIGVGTCVSTENFTCGHEYGGTYQFSAGKWKDISPPTYPPPREDGGFVDDPPDGGVVMVGGCCWMDSSGLSVGWQDVWLYSQGTWTESDPWGGVAPSWILNDGSWVALALGLVAAISVAAVIKKGPPAIP